MWMPRTSPNADGSWPEGLPEFQPDGWPIPEHVQNFNARLAEHDETKGPVFHSCKYEGGYPNIPAYNMLPADVAT